MSVHIPVAELCSFEHTDDCYVLPKDWNRGVRQNKWQGGETAEKHQVKGSCIGSRRWEPTIICCRDAKKTDRNRRATLTKFSS